MFMTSRTHVTRYWRLLTICSILLMLALVACGGGSTTSSTPTQTTKPTPAPSPTAASNMKTYTGDGYTIDYPSNWQASTTANGTVSIADSSNTDGVVIRAVGDTSGKTPDAIISAGLQQLQSKPNYQQLTNIPATTPIGGDTWSQAGATYDETVNGQTVNYKVIALVDVYSPTNSSTQKAMLIILAAPTQMFDQVNTDIFQPMLQSVMFTA